MCGIVGIFSFDGPPPHKRLWPQFVNHLQHRGPDEGAWWADGPFFLGHRRLSIIDLNKGSQPMATASGEFVVTFNGEIYNYVELRNELREAGYSFRTDSDTEVLLHGYHAWGAGLPGRLVGMFAFAIADRKRRELFIARDRFGEKPLFLFNTPKYVAFASELRALAALPDLPHELNIEALGGYLCLNYVPGTATLLKAIWRLPPASWRLFRQGREQSGTYWTPIQRRAVNPMKSCNEALEAWQERFDRAVRFCLRSDVPVGIFLSGGIDSSLVAESAMRQGTLSRAYCIDFQEKTYSEYNSARIVAAKLDLPLEHITLSPDALKDFSKIVDHADDPLADSSALAVWTLSRHAAQGNKVVLGGDGGDELFGGYLTYQATKLHLSVMSRFPGCLRSKIARWGTHLPTSERKVSLSFKLRRFLRAAHLPSGQAHLSWNGAWLPDEAADLIYPGPERETVRMALAANAERLGLDDQCSLLQLQRADLADYLPNDILTKMDRMSMAHGLETRAPFLDYQLADWILQQPNRLKIGKGGELKTLLRTAARKKFGSKIADRPKQGFSIPIHAWMRGPFSETILDLLSQSSIGRLNVIDPVKVKSVVDEHFSGRKSYGFELWGLAFLVAWHRVRIERPPNPPPNLPLVERHFGKNFLE